MHDYNIFFAALSAQFMKIRGLLISRSNFFDALENPQRSPPAAKNPVRDDI